MTKVSELIYDVQELYIDGMSARTIALTLECPIETVLAVLQDMGVEDVADSQREDEIYSPYYGA